MADPTPDFRWTAFYYPEILAGLIELKRTTWPEHTEEDPNDPVIQLYRAFALLSHLQAVRLDHAARELYLPTARLRSSVIALAQLVDYRLATAVPAEATLLAVVSGKLEAPTRLVASRSVFSTAGDGGDGAILFEYDADEDLYGGPNTSLRVLQFDSGTWTDLEGVLPATLWGGANATSNDAIYFGAPLAFNKVGLEVSAAAGEAWFRWEYRGDRSGQPDSVIDVGDGTIAVVVDGVVGASPASPNGGEASGLQVTVRCLRTGRSEACEVDGTAGANTATTTGTLGQTTISTNPADYLVITEWVELPGLRDGSAALQTEDDVEVSWAMPFDAEHRWIPSDPSGSGVLWYWARLRLARLGNCAPPTLADVTIPRKTAWAMEIPVRQGRTVTDKIGSSDGQAGQRLDLNRAPFMALVALTVAGEGWARVDNFLSSAAYDRHFTLAEDPGGTWWVGFGNGIAGKIPASGSPIVATYRIGGDVSGNVGAGAISRDRSGNARIKGVANYRAADGWEPQEGTTAASLDALRVEIPASLRVRGRAVTASDYENLAAEFRTADGSAPVVRALAIEELYGPKTVGVACVGPNGAAPSVADLAELSSYLNGQRRGLQRIGGVVPANTAGVPVAYVPRPVNVDVAVRVLEDYADAAEAKITAALEAILSPTATRLIRDGAGAWIDSGIYLWAWGGEFDPAVLLGAIYTSTPGLVGITVTTPAAGFTLAIGELPTAGTIAVNVTAV
jgi:hypothetical protein